MVREVSQHLCQIGLPVPTSTSDYYRIGRVGKEVLEAYQDTSAIDCEEPHCLLS